jgi:hypothetical protein
VASTTPWEIGEQFTKMLYDQRTRERGYTADIDERMYQTSAAQQAANTLFDRQMFKDAGDYDQQVARDEAARAFTHQENELTRNAKNSGRRGHVAQPAAAPGATGPAAGINAQSAYQHYTQRGVPPIVAAGIVGNIAAESGWDPAVFSGTRRGDSGTAFGAGQWRGPRQEHLFEFAQSRGNSRPTTEDQLDFYVEEGMSGRDPGARRALEEAAKAQTPEQAAEIFMRLYERPADSSSLAHRQSAAREVFGGGGAVAPAAGGGMTVAAPAQRRYPGAQADEQPVVVTDDTAPSQDTQPSAATPEFVSPQPVWTEKDYAENGIKYADTLDVPPDMDVVDTQFFSGAALDQMAKTAPEMLQRIIPVGGFSPEETNQYLVLQPKPGTPQYEHYFPNAGGAQAPTDPNAVVATPNPGAIEAAPVDLQPVTAGAAAAPPPADQRIVSGVGTEPVSNATPTASAPTGARTRRNANGELEILVDGEWRSTGG